MNVPDIIAVIEDDRVLRETLVTILESSGFAVSAFANAAEFLDAVETKRFAAERLACLLLDHHMPGLKGLDLVERMHAGGNPVPALVMTGLATPDMSDRSAALRDCEVLFKPADPDDILAFIAMYARPSRSAGGAHPD